MELSRLPGPLSALSSVLLQMMTIPPPRPPLHTHTVQKAGGEQGGAGGESWAHPHTCPADTEPGPLSGASPPCPPKFPMKLQGPV